MVHPNFLQYDFNSTFDIDKLPILLKEKRVLSLMIMSDVLCVVHTSAIVLGATEIVPSLGKLTVTQNPSHDRAAR